MAAKAQVNSIYSECQPDSLSRLEFVRPTRNVAAVGRRAPFFIAIEDGFSSGKGTDPPHQGLDVLVLNVLIFILIFSDGRGLPVQEAPL